MNSKDKYTIELTAEQMYTISEALDQYGRLCCMQFDEWPLWGQIRAVQPSYKQTISLEQIEEFKDEIQAVQSKYTKGVGASWCASDFVKQCYHIRKEIEHIKCLDVRKKNPDHFCVHCDGATLTRDMDRVKITKVR